MLNSIRNAIIKVQFVNYEVAGLIGARIASKKPMSQIITKAVTDTVSYSRQKPYAKNMVGLPNILGRVEALKKQKEFDGIRHLVSWYFQEANMQYRKLSR